MKTPTTGRPGVWTPWAEILCQDCHAGYVSSDPRHAKVVDSLANQGEISGYSTTCTKCGETVIMGDDKLAMEGDLVALLKRLGFVNASMQQTGGMCSAAGVPVNGGLLMASDDEDGFICWIADEENEDDRYLFDENPASMGQVIAYVLKDAGDTIVTATITRTYKVELVVDEEADAETFADFIPADDPIWTLDSESAEVTS